LYYASLLDNINCLGTHRSHCHDTHVMQNLNGCVMHYSWWLETYKIDWCVSDIILWQRNELYSKDYATKWISLTFKGWIWFCYISKIYRNNITYLIHFHFHNHLIVS
jgi:hypothetical protein